jgi:hypothetical protein
VTGQGLGEVSVANEAGNPVLCAVVVPLWLCHDGKASFYLPTCIQDEAEDLNAELVHQLTADSKAFLQYQRPAIQPEGPQTTTYNPVPKVRMWLWGFFHS